MPMKKTKMLTTSPAIIKLNVPGSENILFKKSVSLQIKMIYAAGNIFGKNAKNCGRKVTGNNCPEKSLLNCCMKKETGSPSFKNKTVPTVINWNPRLPIIKIPSAIKTVMIFGPAKKIAVVSPANITNSAYMANIGKKMVKISNKTDTKKLMEKYSTTPMFERYASLNNPFFLSSLKRPVKLL